MERVERGARRERERGKGRQRLILPGEKSIYIALAGVYERPHGRKVRRLEATYNRSWIKFHGQSARLRFCVT